MYKTKTAGFQSAKRIQEVKGGCDERSAHRRVVVEKADGG
jgi:hypothetical protein